MGSIVNFIKAIITWGIWLGTSGLIKSAIIGLIIASAYTQQGHQFSFGKFNRMLVGETDSGGNSQPVVAHRKSIHSLKHKGQP